MNRYAVIVEFEIELDHHHDFLERVKQQARDSVALEEGCHLFDVCVDPSNHTVLLYEIYSDRAAFDHHLCSAHFKSFDTEVSSWIVRKSVRSLNLEESAQ